MVLQTQRPPVIHPPSRHRNESARARYIRIGDNAGQVAAELWLNGLDIEQIDAYLINPKAPIQQRKPTPKRKAV